MSGKAAMRSCFLVQQLFLCRRNHLQGQPSRWVFGFDDGKLSAAWRTSRLDPRGLQQEPQTIGDQILKRTAL